MRCEETHLKKLLEGFNRKRSGLENYELREVDKNAENMIRIYCETKEEVLIWKTYYEVLRKA